MGSIIRLGLGVPIAALITVVLFKVMAFLIIPEEVVIDEEAAEFNIQLQDVPEELDARRRETTLEDVTQVDPPPPPPQIERQAAEQPSEGLATVMGAIPDFDAPSLNSSNVSFSVSDRDAQPLVRIQPQYPIRAQERGIEGRCLMQFDVTPDGTPTNIRVLNCSSSLFERNAIRAVERWRYQPKVQEGIPVARRGVQTEFIFEFGDD
jgi:protein TonB